jgi:hypothetical protein
MGKRPRCICGKAVYSSLAEAEDECIRMEHRISRPFKIYQCDVAPNIWHITNANTIIRDQLVLGCLTKDHILIISVPHAGRYLSVSPKNPIGTENRDIRKGLDDGTLHIIASQRTQKSPWNCVDEFTRREISKHLHREANVARVFFNMSRDKKAGPVVAQRRLLSFVKEVRDNLSSQTEERIRELLCLTEYDTIAPVKEEVRVITPTPKPEKERRERKVVRLRTIELRKEGVCAWECVKARLVDGESMSTVVEQLIIDECERRK